MALVGENSIVGCSSAQDELYMRGGKLGQAQLAPRMEARLAPRSAFNRGPSCLEPGARRASLI